MTRAGREPARPVRRGSARRRPHPLERVEPRHGGDSRGGAPRLHRPCEDEPLLEGLGRVGVQIVQVCCLLGFAHGQPDRLDRRALPLSARIERGPRRMMDRQLGYRRAGPPVDQVGTVLRPTAPRAARSGAREQPP